MTEEYANRLQKLEALKALGILPYPATVKRTHSGREVLQHFDSLKNANETVSLTGRLRTFRAHGGLTFAHIDDGSETMQIVFRRNIVGEIPYEQLKLLDLGDFLEVTGTLFLTKLGERTADVVEYRIISKALLPLPEKWHGLSDVETRFRKRYLDFIMNPEVKNRMIDRSKIVSAIRHFLEDQGFLEIETPTLQPIYGGGFARPFKTHHNSLDADFFLRISDEMYLKRLIVGGFEKVFEITKVFRNEGIDRDHNPEFTMFEAQIAYKDYRYGMDIFEEIFEHAALKALNTTEIKHGDIEVSVKRPWKRIRLIDSVKEIGGLDASLWKTQEEATKAILPKLTAPRKKEELKRLQSLGECIAFAFEEFVEEKLIQPTIIFDYPVEVSPLAKKSSDERFVERFEAFALGSEIGNNYSELNDPEDLERRFIEEKKKEAAGFDEAHQTDNDYLDAIRHGMPPVCGLGIGIDRMVMLLTGSENIKEVIAFPTLRPQTEVEKQEEESSSEV